eukprot:12376572-Alexandrium_andersonii.AAC.1
MVSGPRTWEDPRRQQGVSSPWLHAPPPHEHARVGEAQQLLHDVLPAQADAEGLGEVRVDGADALGDLAPLLRCRAGCVSAGH